MNARLWPCLWLVAVAACSGDDEPAPAVDAAAIDAAAIDATAIDATDVDAAAIDAPSLPPPVVVAADSLILFQQVDYGSLENPIVAYIDAGGIVHEVRRRSGLWMHTDVSAATGLPPNAEQIWSFPAAATAAASTEDLGLLVRLSDGSLTRVARDTAGAWQRVDITAASGHVAATRWVAGRTRLTRDEHILYTGTDGVFYDLHRDDASPSPAFTASVLSTVPAPAGPITTGEPMIAMYADPTGRPQVVALDPIHADAPLTGAMVGVGAVTGYEGTIPFEDIVWRDAGGGLHASTRTDTNHRDLTALLDLPAAASDLRGSITPLPAPIVVVTYRDGAGHVIRVRGTGAACASCSSSWRMDDLTVATGAPLAAGVVVNQLLRTVVYVGIDGHLHLITAASDRAPWVHTDISAALPP